MVSALSSIFLKDRQISEVSQNARGISDLVQDRDAGAIDHMDEASLQHFGFWRPV
jgi:hypothetical protein